MNSDVQLVIGLQRLDQRIVEVDQEITSLPRHIAEIEKTLDQHLRRLEANRSALTANQKERKRLEGEISVQEQKISKLKSQMIEAKTNEQYRAFQTEISFCEVEIRKCEDRILDLMGESESLEKNVKVAEVSLKHEQEQVEGDKKTAEQKAAAARALMAQLQEERSGTCAAIPPRILQSYEKIRKKRHGIGVADASDGLCAMCRIALRPQYFQDLKKGDEVLYCESCGRILYYVAPQSFDDQVDTQTQTAGTPLPPSL